MNKKIIFIIAIIFIIILVLFILLLVKNKENKNVEDNKNIVLENDERDDSMTTNSLILYFSATGTTKKVAENIKNVTNSDIIEIIPQEKYTSADLNYNNDNSRANKEQNDANSRPKIENTIDINDYDVIYLGYPIWWGDVPKIILTLLDNYNLENKTVIPFCTSGSSGISQSMNTLKSYNKNINWIDGKRFGNSVSNSDIQEWITTLNIQSDININKGDSQEMYIKINNEILTATLEDNSSAEALLKKLEENDITINMHDYSNFEKVGELGFNLPRNDTNITTTYGDIILYQGNQITIYYDTNNWNFTKLGHIDNITQERLKKILGDRDVIVTFSLNK